MKAKFMYAIMAVMMIGSSMTLSAQNKQGNNNQKQRPTKEQMIQNQTNRMVKTLMLDDATAAKFKPVYEKYLNEVRDCRMPENCPFQPGNNPKAQGNDQKADKAARPEMTDAQIAQAIKGQFEQSRKMLDVREKYYTEFSKILSQKQVMKIYQQERNNMHKFRNEMDRRNGQKGNRDGYGHQGQRQGMKQNQQAN